MYARRFLLVLGVWWLLPALLAAETLHQQAVKLMQRPQQVQGAYGQKFEGSEEAVVIKGIHLPKRTQATGPVRSILHVVAMEPQGRPLQFESRIGSVSRLPSLQPDKAQVLYVLKDQRSDSIVLWVEDSDSRHNAEQAAQGTGVGKEMVAAGTYHATTFGAIPVPYLKVNLLAELGSLKEGVVQLDAAAPARVQIIPWVELTGRLRRPSRQKDSAPEPDGMIGDYSSGEVWWLMDSSGQSLLREIWLPKG